MNRFRIPLATRIGFRWSSRRVLTHDVRKGLSITGLVAAITAISAVAGTLDYQDALLAESEASAIRAALAEKALIDCMNAKARWIYDNHTGKGHGKTAVVCRGTEEIPL